MNVNVARTLHSYADSEHQVHFVVIGTQDVDGSYTFDVDWDTTLAYFDEGFIYIEATGEWVDARPDAEIWVDDMSIEVERRLRSNG